MQFLEYLEDRIAPATLLANGSTVTYQDVDGDVVTVKFSKAIFADQTDADHVFIFATGGVDGSNANPQQLQEIDLSMLADPSLSNGVKISVTVKKGVTAGGFPGDGYVNIGTINTSKYLGDVSIKGDLSEIDIANEDAAPQALGKLSVNSFGLNGFLMQASADYQSNIQGDIKEVSIKRDFQYGMFFVSGDIAKFSVGGSIIGSTFGSGYVSLMNGTLGTLTVAKDIVGGAEPSANISAALGVGTVKVGGSVIGGSSASANISSNGTINSVTIGGDLKGAGGNTGNITADVISSVKIGGSVFGGYGTASGSINAVSELGSANIGGDVVGGNISGTENLFAMGAIDAGKIGSLSIGGSLIAGKDLSVSDLEKSGSISSGSTIGTLVIKGGVIGNQTHTANISAGGETVSGGTSNVAIGKLSVSGDVRFANILAGYDTFLSPINGSAQIGSVGIGGDLVATNIVAGIEAGADGYFGTSDDSVINSFDPNIVANIASLLVKGRIVGDTMGNTGIVSSSFGKVSLSGNSYTSILLAQPYAVPYVLTPTTPAVGNGAQTAATYVMV